MMQDRSLFEYAVLRLVPRVEREEFINIGVVMYCKKQQFLECKIQLDVPRLAALFKDLDIEELSEHINSFKTICEGKNGGLIATLDAPSRFRWLTATRSTILQTSKVHPGLCNDPHEKIASLFTQFVL